MDGAAGAGRLRGSEAVAAAAVALASIRSPKPRASWRGRARTRAGRSRISVSEQQCYSKFLVNSCLDKAREKRRTALAALHAIENEAERYQRQAKVDERDRELAKADAEFKQEEARRAALPPPPPYQPRGDAPRSRSRSSIAALSMRPG